MEPFAVGFVTYRHNWLTEILDNISEIISTKKYDTDTSLSFSSLTFAKGFVNFITK